MGKLGEHVSDVLKGHKNKGGGKRSTPAKSNARSLAMMGNQNARKHGKFSKKG